MVSLREGGLLHQGARYLYRLEFDTHSAERIQRSEE